MKVEQDSDLRRLVDAITNVEGVVAIAERKETMTNTQTMIYSQSLKMMRSCGGTEGNYSKTLANYAYLLRSSHEV